MCKEPNKLPDGSVVVCRKCEQCLRNKINDWVGRNIAESKVSTKTVAVTLTYGRNEANEKIHERTVALTYSDVQKYIKLLRRHGYDVRYFVTGEYGSLNGRAHWHGILHFKGMVPDLVNRQNFMHEEENTKFWPHGWSFWDYNMGYGSARYVCKYILKNQADEVAQNEQPRMSKKPPIGMAYFEQLAEQYVKQGLAPQSLEYTFPDVRFTKKDGSSELVKFWLRDRTAELYLEHYIAKWEEAYPGRETPKSELVDLFKEYGQVVKDEQRLLIRREFPKGEGRGGWFTPNQIRAAVEEAARREQEWRRQQATSDMYRWYKKRIKEAANVQEKEKRQKEYIDFKNERAEAEYERIAQAICKSNNVSREHFDTYKEQYDYEFSPEGYS